MPLKGVVHINLLLSYWVFGLLCIGYCPTGALLVVQIRSVQSQGVCRQLNTEKLYQPTCLISCCFHHISWSYLVLYFFNCRVNLMHCGLWFDEAMTKSLL